MHTPARLSALAAELFVGTSPVGRVIQRYRPYICPFHELIQVIPHGAHQLDVGCGRGLFLGLLAAAGQIASGVGFDLSAEAIEAARAMARRLEQNGCKARLTFESLSVTDPWPTGDFDVVSVIDVVHHLPASVQEHFIKRAAAHVRPGGLLVYKDMVRRPHWRAWANRIHDLLLARQWIHYWPVSDVERQAHGSGMEEARALNIDMLWYGHELRVFRKPL